MNIYFVYIYRHPITMIPFYVGYGKNNRHLDHLNEAIRKPTPQTKEHKLNTIRKIIREGMEPIIEIIDSELSKEQACELEIFLISEIGRMDKNKGPLTNLTMGGDGNRDWSLESRKQLSDRSKNMISAKDPNSGIKFRIHKDDPKWVSGELVGQNYQEVNSNKNGKLDDYILAKDQVGNFFKVKPDDPKWISGELVGVKKGIPASQKCIESSRKRKGISHSSDHNIKVSKALKGCKWIHNFSTGETSRIMALDTSIPDGFVLVSGPHRLLTLDQEKQLQTLKKEEKKRNRLETASERKIINSNAQKKFRKENPFHGMNEDQINFVIHIVELFGNKPLVPLKNSTGKTLSYVRAFSVYYSNKYNVSLHTIFSIVNGKKPNVINEISKMREDLNSICQEILISQ